MSEDKGPKGDDRSKSRPWEKGGPSPNPDGRPITRHIKTLTASIEPFAAKFLAIDHRVVAERNGVPVTFGDMVMLELATTAKKDPKQLALYLEIMQRAYAADSKLKQEIYAAAVFHKDYYGPKFEFAERMGRSSPDILPHPDDIILLSNSEVRFVGPVDRDQQRVMQRVLKEQSNLVDAARLLVNDIRKDGENEVAENLWKKLRRRFYRINPVVPPRKRLKYPKLPKTGQDTEQDSRLRRTY